jgi:hypothetical protein
MEFQCTFHTFLVWFPKRDFGRSIEHFQKITSRQFSIIISYLVWLWLWPVPDLPIDCIGCSLGALELWGPENDKKRLIWN